MPAPGVPLARRLGLLDAVVLGLGAMLGAGVFVVVAPASALAGPGLLLALVLAAGVAACNATSSAVLAARRAVSGGAYAHGRELLGPLPGFLAGWAFLVGKTASAAAIALTLGAYAVPQAARPVALAAVLAATLLNRRGVRATAGAAGVMLVVVLATLAVAVLAVLFGGQVDPGRLALSGADVDPGGLFGAAGLLFFAFAGYARVTTLGEEVREPRTTIPRAVALSLAVAVGVYAVVATVVLAGLPADQLASSVTPVADAVAAGGAGVLVPVVRTGAVVAAAAVLLSVLAGVGRTAYAMASAGDLPRVLSAVDQRAAVPVRAGDAAAVVVVVLVLVLPVSTAVALSACTVLVYYAVAHASALRLRGRPGLGVVAALGLAGCLLLAVTLPGRVVLSAAAVLVAGVVLRAVVARATLPVGRRR